MRTAAPSTFAMALAAIVLADGAAHAQDVPRDFISGNGRFLKQSPSDPPAGEATFGITGGVRMEDWFGDLVYADSALGLQVKALAITGYLRVGTDSADTKGQSIGTRDICGAARTNRFGDVFFRVRATDNGTLNGHPGQRDTLAIGLATADGALVYFAHGSLGDPTPGKGDIRLHAGNRNSTPPSTPPDCRVSLEGLVPTDDTTQPTVAITSPSDGATVSGTVAVRASASDDVGVAGVQFFVDGAPVGAEDTTAPYEVAWETTAVADGEHTLTARARDAAGNIGTSAPVTATVSNGAPPPATTRSEEDAATYSGWWFAITDADAGAPLSGGTAQASNAAGSTATFTFTGTGIAWLSLRCEVCGTARVFIDGTLVETVDTFAPARSTGVVFSRTGLPTGVSHTLVVEVTGTANPSSNGAFIVVDAFDVTS